MFPSNHHEPCINLNQVSPDPVVVDDDAGVPAFGTAVCVNDVFGVDVVADVGAADDVGVAVTSGVIMIDCVGYGRVLLLWLLVMS